MHNKPLLQIFLIPSRTIFTFWQTNTVLQTGCFPPKPEMLIPDPFSGSVGFLFWVRVFAVGFETLILTVTDGVLALISCFGSFFDKNPVDEEASEHWANKKSKKPTKVIKMGDLICRFWGEKKQCQIFENYI